jgi:hypothetical protein
MNMNKKIAILALVAIMMVTAVGYAAFSDRLAVNGTVSSSDFDVRFVPINNAANVVVYINGQSVSPLGDEVNVADHLDIGITGLIPGTEYPVYVAVKNFGSTPAVLDQDSFQLKPENSVFEVTSYPGADVLGTVLYKDNTVVYPFKVKCNAEATEGTSSISEKFTATLIFKQP